MFDSEQFPNRPDHPDFWRLSEIVLQMDGKIEEGGDSLREAVGTSIDFDSLMYMCNQRAAISLERMGPGLSRSPQLISVLAAGIFDGIVTGIQFEKRGGHREQQ